MTDRLNRNEARKRISEWLVRGAVSFSNHARAEIPEDAAEEGKEEVMNCPDCGSSHFPMKRETWHYKECGLSNVMLYDVPVHRCADCSEVEVVIPRLPELQCPSGRRA